MKKICVFCGSSRGNTPEYAAAAIHLGRLLAKRKLDLVYGGARSGTMGIIADTVLKEGGEVTGIIPRLLVEKEVSHTGLTEIRVVDSLYERKRLMAELSDGFIALPGGLGTLNEVFEVLTWGQLGLHGKPCGLLNCRGYFDALIRMLDHAVSEGFLLPAHRAMVLVEETAEDLLELFVSYQPTSVRKWDAGRRTS